jgi:hypothetical protein
MSVIVTQHCLQLYLIVYKLNCIFHDSFDLMEITNYHRFEINVFYCKVRGPGSSVGIVTDYELEGPGSNPGGDEIFRPSRPALGPNQPPVNGYRVFPGGKVRPGRAADHSPPSSAAVMEE